MFGSTASLVVCFIDRNRFQFYVAGGQPILTMEVPATVIKNLEVVGRDSLYVLINQWLKQYALGGNRIFLVLSAATTFDKDIPEPDENTQETEILKFFDLVPFEELTTKVISVKNGKHVFAINKTYLESIQHGFLLQGLRVVGVVPVFVLGPHAAKKVLDNDMGAYVIKQAQSLLPYSFVDTQETNSGRSFTSVEAPPASKTSSRMIVMVSIFGILLLVLVFLLFTQNG